MKRPVRRAARAFTLMEILVVIALIAGIATLVMTNIGGIFGSASADLEKTKVREGFETPLFSYRMNVGTYPSTEEGLKALLVAPDGKADRWKGPYVKGEKSLVDGFGKPYGYRFPGTHNPSGYDLWSNGPDQQEGTADDIGNWEPAK